MASINKLTAKQIVNLPPGLHSDGGNLYLAVRPGGSRQWVMRYRTAGKQREMGLGGAGPGGMPLVEARSKAGMIRAQLRGGVDPLEAKIEAAKVPSIPTFRVAMDEYISRNEPSWKNPKSADQWRASLKTHAHSILDKKVNQISADDIVAVLDPIWYALPETAKRVRGRIEAILSLSKTRGHRAGENPAAWRDNLKNVFRSTPKLVHGHFAAMDYDHIPDFMTTLRAQSSLSALVNEWIILTTARATVGVSLTWSEIDLAKKIWTTSAARMKGDKQAAVENDDHVVPLQERALEILQLASRLRITGDPTELVFPSTNSKPLTLTSLDHCRERLDVHVTTHGFRTTFRTWVAQETFHEDCIAEKALAHLIGDEVQRAYNRGDLLEKRRMRDAACRCRF